VTLYIGIDIGVHGGLAVINSETKEISIHSIPIFKTSSKRKRKNRKTGISEMKVVERSHYDKRGMKNLIKMYKKNSYSCIEKVHAMITDGAVQSFALGKGSGLWEGMLESLEMKYLDVTPSVWKRYFDLINKPKSESVKKALELYPQTHDIIMAQKGSDRDGFAEALLLAHYGMKHE
jgi:hypothetical protein